MIPLHAGWSICLAAWLPLMTPAVAGQDQAQTPVLRQPATQAVVTHLLTQDDERLLEEIEHGCFLYFWNEVGSIGKLVKDRKKATICSAAAVGFQLSSLPIGVERGWITREQGTKRARQILETLR
ncbi:MAG: hypothetical protein GY927_15360, partial [bacterium]|nr:hypothetical protein [bacterium]